jgi:peptide/nickel transport system substrate-binding protein
VIAAAAGLSIALALSACTQGDPGSATDEVLDIVLEAEPTAMDPCDLNYNLNSRVLTDNVIEALTSLDPDTGDILPKLAVSWEAVEPDLYQFSLREGVTFSDGEALNAAAAAKAINRTFIPELECGVRGFVFSDVELEATVVDDMTVEVATSAPDPILPLRLSFLGIGSPAATEDDRKEDMPVGTGPFVVETWDRGLSITLAQNEDYWGETPSIEAVKYQWREDSSVRANMVRTGDADLAINIAPQHADTELAVKYPMAETFFLRFDTFAEPMDDIRVREAINYAIDRDGLISAVLGGNATPAKEVIVKNVVGYDDSIPVWPFDKEKAADLIADAKASGVDTEREIIIYGREGFYPGSIDSLQAISQMLNDVGLNTRVERLDREAWLNDVLLKPFPDGRAAITQNVHGNSTGDPIFTVVTKFMSTGAESTLNDSHLDDLIATAIASSGADRTAAFEEVFRYMREEIVPVAAIATMDGILLKSAELAYSPNLQTADYLRVADMSWAD